MDFSNRIRKMRLPNNNEVAMQQQQNSRKQYKLNQQIQKSSQYQDSGGGGNEEHIDSAGEISDNFAHPIKPKQMMAQAENNLRKIVHQKQPVKPTGSSGMDSGLDSSGKRPVTQTDSNTSTGSVSAHNANIKLDLERRLALSLNEKRQQQMRVREIPEFRNINRSHENNQISENVENIDNKQNKKLMKKRSRHTPSPLNNDQAESNSHQIKIKYPPINSNGQIIKHEQESDDDSYIDESTAKNSSSRAEVVQKDIYEDYPADDENDEEKSVNSSNQGHEHVDHNNNIASTQPLVENTAIASKKPVKIQVSNVTSLPANMVHGLYDQKQALVVTTSNSDCTSSNKESCSCTTTSSEFQSSHHQCCSSDTSNSIKNIGNNNNNKKIVDINPIQEEDEDGTTLKVENQPKEQVEKSLVPRSNKQYVNSYGPSSAASARAVPAQQQNSSKYTNTIAKVPSTVKAQPTSKRVNGVTLRDLYSLRAVLSDSDNGTVFSGRRRIDNAAVAIKRIMKSKVKRWHMIKEKSVPMEIALLRKVNETRHAGVVTLLEWFECSDCFLLVMARPTPVLDLFDYVSEKKRLDETTCKQIFVQVVQAMIHCHQRSVLHRDIKLENILVKTDTLISTIIDFGCGTHLHSNLYKDFAGTPQYYPPEYYICKQYHGLPAAVWSVGVMLYAMLCGRLPFASAHEIVHLEPSWHGSFCRKISPAAKDLVEHMLKKQPRRRLQMQEILKHRWLKNTKYDATTGHVTILQEPDNGQAFQDIIQSVKEPVSAKTSNSSSGNSSATSGSTGKTFQMFN